jgi:hypothetical protein
MLVRRCGMALLRLLVLLSLCGALPAVAVAQQADSLADRTLWCGSAFNWLARDADDAGDAEGAAIFDAWSLLFTERAATALLRDGFDAAAIERRIAASDEAVLEEMQEKTMRYDVESCPELGAE